MRLIAGRSMGWTNRLWQGGKRMGTVKEYSDTLMIVLLKARAPEKYKDRVQNEVVGKGGKDLYQTATDDELEARMAAIEAEAYGKAKARETPQMTLTRKDKIEYLALLEEKWRRQARTNVLDFARFTMPTFFDGWFHRTYYDYLTRFANREIRRLMVFVPPQSGKSQGSTRNLPAYLLGKIRNVRSPWCPIRRTSPASSTERSSASSIPPNTRSCSPTPASPA
jgi:hypothetical protein